MTYAETCRHNKSYVLISPDSNPMNAYKAKVLDVRGVKGAEELTWVWEGESVRQLVVAHLQLHASLKPRTRRTLLADQSAY